MNRCFIIFVAAPKYSTSFGLILLSKEGNVINSEFFDSFSNGYKCRISDVSFKPKEKISFIESDHKIEADFDSVNQIYKGAIVSENKKNEDVCIFIHEIPNLKDLGFSKNFHI